MKKIKAAEDEMFERAIHLRDNGELENAVNEFSKLISMYPNQTKIGGVHTVLAGVYTDLDDHNNAAINFRKATELNPKSELASLGLYVSYVKLNRDVEAIEELIRFLSKYPAKLYLVTLDELLDGLEKGYMASFGAAIKRLAALNGLPNAGGNAQGQRSPKKRGFN